MKSITQTHTFICRVTNQPVFLRRGGVFSESKADGEHTSHSLLVHYAFWYTLDRQVGNRDVG